MERKQLIQLSQVQWHEFDTGEELAVSLASAVSSALTQAVSIRGKAVLIVSGGTTPFRFFEILSEERVPWKDVFITLADERFVPESTPRSNAGLVREKLLGHNKKASHAVFVPLFSDTDNPDLAAQDAEKRLATIPFPPDILILGMGNDGHTASFFPDAERLEECLDPEAQRLVMPLEAPSAGEERLTLTLSYLARARMPFVHIEGSIKKALLQEGLVHECHLPICRVIDALLSPVQVFWAPHYGESHTIRNMAGESQAKETV